MNAKISVLVICVEAIIYLLFCNLHDRTFNAEAAARRCFFFIHFILIWLYSSSNACKYICLIYAKQIAHSLDTI